MLCIKLTPLQNIQSEGILGVKKPQKINVFIRQWLSDFERWNNFIQNNSLLDMFL